MSMSIETLISIAGMPISIETSEPQTPVVSRAGEPLVEGPPALAVAVQEADQAQPPSKVDLRAEGRVALPETFRVAARVARAVAAPVTSVAAAHAAAHLVEAHLAAVHLAAGVDPVAPAQRVAAPHVVVAVMAVVVINKYGINKTLASRACGQWEAL